MTSARAARKRKFAHLSSGGRFLETIPLGRCSECGAISYVSRHAAKKEMRKRWPQGGMSVSPCGAVFHIVPRDIGQNGAG